MNLKENLPRIIEEDRDDMAEEGANPFVCWNEIDFFLNKQCIEILQAELKRRNEMKRKRKRY